MLPQNLKYQPKVESAPARRYRTNIQPQTGTTFNPSETIIINIPTRNNTALIPSESVLRFNASVTFAAATLQASLDSGGAHGFINRLRVFHGSNLLQDIQDYGQLAKILFDFQMPLDSVQGRYSVSAGTENNYIADVSGQKVGLTKPLNRGRNYVPIGTDSLGTALSGATVLGAGVANTSPTLGFSLNLISLVGALAGNKYLPLWEMTAAPLRVELVLAANAEQAMLVGPTATTTFQLTNVEYIGEFLELPDSAIGAIKAGSSSPLQMVLPDYRSYTFSQAVTAGTATSVSMPIPAKFSSLKSLFVASRNATPAVTRYPYASGPLGLTQYQFRIGSEVLPSNPPTVASEWFSEACKCFGSIADLDYQPAIDLDGYCNTNPAAIAANWYNGALSQSGGFIVGIDLESYMSSDKSSIFAGMNTNTSDIFFLPQITPFTGTSNIFFTAYANYDTVLVCENGVAYTRF
jgi:hypothetical protein